MTYVFLSYGYFPEFKSATDWLKKTTFYTGLLECLAKEHKVIYITQINANSYRLHHNVHYHFVNFEKRKNLFPLKINLFTKRLNPDVVIIQGMHHPLQMIQLRLLLKKRVKILAQHHAEQPFKGIRKQLQKTAGHFADGFLFASMGIGMDWVKKGNISSPKKIFEVMEVSSLFYPGDKAEAKLITKVSGKLAFLWVGRLNENKDPLNVVQAFLEFAKIKPGVRLYMIYHTHELLSQLMQILDDDANKAAVTLVGQVAHADLFFWYNSCDFILSGSHYEGSGTAVCEAMSCGCIPVVTDISSFRMITDHGNYGLLYPAGNREDLLSALLKTDELDRVAMREKVLSQFRAKLSFDAIAKTIGDVVTALGNDNANIQH